jgi:formate dehydrogenase subunit gamma
MVGLVGRWGLRLRDDFRRLGRWISDDRTWLRRRTRDDAKLGKFNPGQKLNAVFLGAAAVLMFVSGVMLKWFSLFGLELRTGATFVHDWFALGIWIAVIGHVLFAFRDPVALRGMARGTVPARWARRLRPRWYEEITGRLAERFKQSSNDS